jgi:hypothetical protein
MELDPLSHTTPKKILLDFINAMSHIRWKRDIKNVGKLARVVLIKVILPPWERYMLCQPESLLFVILKIRA